VKLERDPFQPFAAAMTQKNLLSKRRLVVRWVGVVVLLLGLVSAGVVYSVGESHSAKLAHGQETVGGPGQHSTSDSNATGSAGVDFTRWEPLCQTSHGADRTHSRHASVTRRA